MAACCSKEKLFEGKWYQHPPLRNALISGFISGISFILAHLNLIPSYSEILLYAVAIILGAYHWAWEGIEKVLEEQKVGIDILMLAAAVGAAILGMWDEAAFLVFLYGAAEGIEEYTYARTRHSIQGLLDLAPKKALALRDGEETFIPAEELKVGDIFRVRPGESVATDGIVMRGKSSVDESPVTGESIPVEKEEGSKVFAATLNREGTLEIRTTATFENNTLSKIVHLVEEAQEQKGKAQIFIEKFGNIYSPMVLVGALLLIAIPVFMGLPTVEWTTRAAVLLVAAAPCALVMSTPITIAAGIGKAGKSGILIKGGMHLESLGKIRAIAFDKTGTLTRGKPAVTDILSLSSKEFDMLTIAYSVERFSEHPLALAIVEKAREMGINPLEATEFESFTGSGVKAKVEGKVYHVGKPELFEELGLNIQEIPEVKKLKEEGKTVILIGTSERLEGILGLRDELRPEAKAVVKKLHQLGIKTLMLTGDNNRTAQAIAKELGIEEVKADLKPQDKVEAIRMLVEKHGAVAMVGDGINDAPALAQATLGIAMGTAGTDAAIEAADIALMADDLNKVLFALSLGKKAKRISAQNIVFSILLLAVLIPSALWGALSVAMAVLLHETSEILAVANGLRMRNVE